MWTHWVDGDDVWTRVDSVHGPSWKRLLSDHCSVAPAVGRAVTAARWQRGCGCGSSLVAERQDWSWLVRSLLVYPLTQWLEQPLVQTVPWAACQSWRLLEEFPLLRCLPCRVVRTWKTGHFYFALSCIFQLILAFGCCLWCTVVLDLSGDPACTSLGLTVDTCSSRGFGRIYSIFYVVVNSNPEAVLASIRSGMEKCAQSMLLVAVSLSAARTLKCGHYFCESFISCQFAAFFFLLLSAAGALDDEEFFVIEGSV